MGSLQKSIDEAEKEVLKLEEKIELENQEIRAASLRGEGEAIKTFTKKLHESKFRLDAAFAKLDLLRSEIEGRTKEFEDELESLMTVSR